MRPPFARALGSSESQLRHKNDASSDLDRIFHPCLIACMGAGRVPTSDEVEALAERIRSNVNGAQRSVAWRDLSKDSPVRLRAVAAAHLAFGLHLDPAGLAFMERT